MKIRWEKKALTGIRMNKTIKASLKDKNGILGEMTTHLNKKLTISTLSSMKIQLKFQKRFLKTILKILPKTQMKMKTWNLQKIQIQKKKNQSQKTNLNLQENLNKKLKTPQMISLLETIMTKQKLLQLGLMRMILTLENSQTICIFQSQRLLMTLISLKTQKI